MINSSGPDSLRFVAPHLTGGQLEEAHCSEESQPRALSRLSLPKVWGQVGRSDPTKGVEPLGLAIDQLQDFEGIRGSVNIAS
ncbi:hypothetical protein ACFW5I_34230 [Streptomyces sp. NPDC058818]|uniref:hypothetical protein n=1 Tax=Streptomyces sp. NPDC058818 TaxID=3346640 RepID=UPI0036BFB9AA